VNLEKPLEVEIGKLLHERGLTLAVAESCTGGLVGHRVTNVPGSSEYFAGGVIVYSYEAKVKLLDVAWDTLNALGAVSSETVLEMARGAKKLLDVNIAVSVSGIAGPGGGTESKPVGTTWVGLVTDDGEWAQEFHFQGSREENKEFSADAAFQMILEYLLGELKK
jgi:PncC family amidohydrolase